MPPPLSLAQLRTFYDDGYIVIRGAVPSHLVDQARELADDLGETEHERQAQQAALARLFNEGACKPAAEQLVGGARLRPIVGGQNAKRTPHLATGRMEESGYPYDSVPWFNWTGHMDGLWSGGGPILQSREDDPADWDRGMGTNGSPKEPRVLGGEGLQANIQNFTLLCGVALSEQLEDGAGQLGLLRGAHHVIESVYQRQAALGGPVGPGGPGWERENHAAPNGHGIRYYPDEVRKAFATTSAATSDGMLWPKPDIVRLRKGDGVLVLHECPHAATRCCEELGASTRYQVYFRLYREDRPKGKESTFPEALVDIWREFDGMAATVALVRQSKIGAARL
eukprot:SAG31_NODE_4304_length_3370_cov_1.370835_2_plen_339_part_00